ncbi:MAG TPA: hypothetical protein VF754_03935, partial [Pyrinomonadaceae bacterium]
IDLSAALDTHRRTRALATLVLKHNARRERFSTVLTRDGLVQGFGPAPQASDNADSASARAARDSSESVGAEGVNGMLGGVGATVEAVEDVPLMFTGIQILEPRIFDYIPRGVFSHTTTDVYPQAIARGESIAAHVADGMWHELSTIQRYLEISLELMKQEGREVEAGAGSLIEEGAEVQEAVLWEQARVARGARVRRAVLGAGVEVGSGETIENAAVVRAELVDGSERPPKALAGVRRGANFVVPLAQ